MSQLLADFLYAACDYAWHNPNPNTNARVWSIMLAFFEEYGVKS